MTDKPPVQPNVVVLTGMSGAGRSTAAKALEDLGYTVIDNLPLSLIVDVVKQRDLWEMHDRLAVVVDARGGINVDDLRKPLYTLRGMGLATATIFLDADDDVLLRRYDENRRPHPVPAPTLAESVRTEREMLSDLRAMADVVIDTTGYNVHDLRHRVESEFRDANLDRRLRLLVQSFGFKHGAPRDVDLMFDVRFLPNPHWVEELRPLTGTDQPVRDYVLGDGDAVEFAGKVTDLLEFLLPRFEAEGKSYVVVAIGCTGGRHRSVALAEHLGDWAEAQGIRTTVRHRDRER